MTTINIADLDKAAVLAALYNGSRPIGMGWLRAEEGEMTVEQARKIIDSGSDDHGHTNLYFDYLKGRPLKADLSKDEFDPWLYDRDNGNGAAYRLIEALR